LEKMESAAFRVAVAVQETEIQTFTRGSMRAIPERACPATLAAPGQQ
jgi:hypothetical protein